jgi:hypothetical protein
MTAWIRRILVGAALVAGLLGTGSAAHADALCARVSPFQVTRGSTICVPLP